MLKVGTTFSGIGAVEQALKNLGIQHEVSWACDIDKYAKQTYLANHKCNVFYDDIRKIDIDNLEEVDLYVFGFPCQDISIAGKKDLSIGRTKLVQYSIDILKKLRPKYFIFENVKGLLGAKYKEFFDDIMNQIHDIGYYTQYEVLNSLHFDIPQNRERLYCIGNLDSFPKNLSVPKIPTSKRISSILDIGCTAYINANHKFYNTIGRLKKSYLQFDRNGKKQNSASDRVYFLDSYCPTLTTKVDTPMILLSNKTSIPWNKDIRPLSILERTRLQGFPDTFQFPVSKSQAMKQLGNSMTVNVVEHTIRVLLST